MTLDLNSKKENMLLYFNNKHTDNIYSVLTIANEKKLFGRTKICSIHLQIFSIFQRHSFSKDMLGVQILLLDLCGDIITYNKKQ